MAVALNEKAMLIKVELKKWGGTKTDKSLSEKIGYDSNTDASLYSVSKKVVSAFALSIVLLMQKIGLRKGFHLIEMIERNW